MNRLSLELIRLYAPAAKPAAGTDDEPLALIDAQGQVRALVLALARPADWAALSAVWQGVQAELGWPAPAIVVQGVDAYQLWFSLAAPVPVATGHAVLQALVARYLSDLAPHRLRLLPAVDQAVAPADRHAALVPQCLADEQWSAFVSADLAPVFSETPWLDMAPNLDGQAGLLAGLKSISPDALQAALAKLSLRADASAPAHSGGPSAALAQQDPRRFLLAVMNDETVALALRIEAAKALLGH
jgi:hypothetical protein